MIGTIMHHLNDEQRAAAMDDLAYHIEVNKAE
jgi:hypothetical protein